MPCLLLLRSYPGISLSSPFCKCIDKLLGELQQTSSPVFLSFCERERERGVSVNIQIYLALTN